jgi:CDP-glucose 4,6-dehydratase
LSKLFGGVYSGRNVLVTGHTGFKGSWLCLWLTALGAHVSGLALAPDTEPSHWNLLGLKTVQDLRMDLRDGDTVRQALVEVEPEIIFHLAAQPLVRRSYREPLSTFDTNVMGLVHLMEAIRTTQSMRALVSVATDKVYQEHVTTGYREDDPLGGHDPYSTSKACAELVADCYRKSFLNDGGIRVASARAGNVIGGGDWSEDRLIPDMVRAVSAGDTLHIRNPNAIRPWQHVLEPLSGYLRLGQQLLTGKQAEGPWNFGPAADATLSVQELISRTKPYWPDLHTVYQAGPHPHEAAVLRLDCAKAERNLGWKPVWNIDEALRHTAGWYRAYYEQDQLRSNEDLQSYIDAAQAAGLGWTA